MPIYTETHKPHIAPKQKSCIPSDLNKTTTTTKKSENFKVRSSLGYYFIQNFIAELKNLSREINKNELSTSIYLLRKKRIVFYSPQPVFFGKKNPLIKV